MVVYGFAVGEAPDVCVEAAVAGLNLHKCPGIGNGGFDLQAVAHDPGVAHQLLLFFPVVPGNFVCIKIVECLAITLALVEDSQPVQASLCSLQDQKLE